MDWKKLAAPGGTRDSSLRALELRNAIARAGGFRISDGFIHPEDLVAIGLLAEHEAEQHALERTASS